MELLFFSSVYVFLGRVCILHTPMRCSIYHITLCFSYTFSLLSTSYSCWCEPPPSLFLIHLLFPSELLLHSLCVCVSCVPTCIILLLLSSCRLNVMPSKWIYVFKLQWLQWLRQPQNSSSAYCGPTFLKQTMEFQFFFTTYEYIFLYKYILYTNYNAVCVIIDATTQKLSKKLVKFLWFIEKERCIRYTMKKTVKIACYYCLFWN